MAATDQQILDEARDSLLRILQTDATFMSSSEKQMRQLEISELKDLIASYESKVVAAAGTTPTGGRRFMMPVRRVNV